MPGDHVCKQPEIVRAFYTLLNANYRNINTAAKNAGKPWSIAEDEELKKMYENGATKSELKEYFERTLGSIQSRLAKLGLIEDKRKK